MKHLFLFSLLLIGKSAIGQEEPTFNYSTDFETIFEASNNPDGALHYEKLLKRFQENDTTLRNNEVLALLIGFTDSKRFRPYSYVSTERKIYRLNEEEKYKEAHALADSFLIHVPLSQEALIENSYAFYMLNQQDSADYYMWQYRKIMDAMASSGNGLTAETAIFSLGPADGQNFIRKYLGMGIGTMGSGRDKYGNFVDMLEATWKDDETGETKNVMLYFQIEHAVKKMFAGSEDDPEKTKGKNTKKKED